jgi:hypothetical protein
LQGHDDDVSLQFTLGFDGNIAHIGSLVFPVSEESIVVSTKLPRFGDRWFKGYQLPRQSYNRVFKPEYQTVSGAKGYSKGWIRDEFLNPLVIITRLVTCEGKYSTFKACHFHLLAHFQFGKPLNFLFYFLKSLEKMSSQVRKNVTNPSHSLFHHGLIKLLVVSELRKQDRTWDDFLYQFLNPHLTVKTTKKSIDFGTANPSHSHPPKSQIPPINPTPSSAKKPKNPIVDPQLSSTPIDSKQKKMKDSFHHDFPPIPTKR